MDPNKIINLDSEDYDDSDDEIYLDPSEVGEEFIIEADGFPEDMDDGEGGELDENGEGEEGEDGVDLGPVDSDDSVQRFLTHTDSVYCVAINPTQQNIVATGGGDDKAYLWKLDDGTQLFELTGHTDSIAGIAFDSTGKLLATAGLDCAVKIWEVSTGKQLHSLDGPSESIDWVQWHPRGPVLIAGAGDGTCWMWNAQTGEFMQVFSGHSGPVNCGSFTPDGKLVCTGSADGSIRVWSPKTGASLFTLAGHGFHESEVTSIDCHHDNALILTGSADKTARVANVNTGKAMGTLTYHTDTVETVTFSKATGYGITGSIDSKIGIWDLGTLQLRQTCSHDHGVVKILCHPTQPFLFSASVDRTVRLWDLRTANPISVWKGHQDALLDFAVTADGNTVVTAGDDHVSLVFKVQQS